MGCLSTAADAETRKGASGPPASRPRGRSPRAGASVLACYALLTYRWRARHILAKDQPEWGDPQGPLLVTFVVVFMLLSAWVAEMKVYLTP